MKFILEIIYLCPHQIVVIIRVTYYASARLPHWAEIFGYDTAVISGAIGSLTSYFHLSPAETGWAVSCVVVGCVIGSFSAGYLSKRFGRKKSLMVSALLFTISAVGTSLLHVHPFCDLSHYRWTGSHSRQQYHRCICLKSHRKTCAAEH